MTHVLNRAPAFQNRMITPQIDEGGEVVITGRITEPDEGDLFTLLVDWADGTERASNSILPMGWMSQFDIVSGTQVLYLASDQTYVLNHVYSAAGSYQVLVAIEDDDRGLGESRTPVRIENDGNQLYGVTWNNPNASFDVDADGFVSPLDVLLIINEANTVGFSNLMSRVSDFNVLQPLYFDTNADGLLSPLDALIVINYLNGVIHSGKGDSVATDAVQERRKVGSQFKGIRNEPSRERVSYRIQATAKCGREKNGC